MFEKYKFAEVALYKHVVPYHGSEAVRCIVPELLGDELIGRYFYEFSQPTYIDRFLLDAILEDVVGKERADLLSAYYTEEDFMSFLTEGCVKYLDGSNNEVDDSFACKCQKDMVDIQFYTEEEGEKKKGAFPVVKYLEIEPYEDDIEKESSLKKKAWKDTEWRYAYVEVADVSRPIASCGGRTETSEVKVRRLYEFSKPVDFDFIEQFVLDDVLGSEAEEVSLIWDDLGLEVFETDCREWFDKEGNEVEAYSPDACRCKLVSVRIEGVIDEEEKDRYYSDADEEVTVNVEEYKKEASIKKESKADTYKYVMVSHYLDFLPIVGGLDVVSDYIGTYCYEFRNPVKEEDLPKIMAKELPRLFHIENDEFYNSEFDYDISYLSDGVEMRTGVVECRDETRRFVEGCDTSEASYEVVEAFVIKPYKESPCPEEEIELIEN